MLAAAGLCAPSTPIARLPLCGFIELIKEDYSNVIYSTTARALVEARNLAIPGFVHSKTSLPE